MHLLSTLSVLALVLIATIGCGTQDSSVSGGAGVAAASSDLQAGQLPDGWQFQGDAAPPTDAWTWSDDAKRWMGPDSIAGAGDSTERLADATTALPDGTVALPDGAFRLPDGTVVAADGAPAGGTADTDPLDGALADSAGDGAVTDGGKPAPTAGELGSACTKPADCDAGLYCFAQGTPQAYCGKVGCLSHVECAANTEEPMCCVQYGNQKYCAKQFGGATQCGNQDKPAGADCKAGGQSDCSKNNGGFCLQTQSAAQCVDGCTSASKSCPIGTKCQVFEGGTGGCIPFTPDKADATSCAGKTIGGCGAGSWCIEAYSGDPLAYCATLCKDDSVCASGFACSIYSPNQGICQKFGSVAGGSSCAGDRFSCQKGMFCLGAGSATAVCAPLCQNDVDCSAYAKTINQVATCSKGPGGNFGACVPKGDKANGDNCSKNPSSCTSGSWCVGGYDVYNPDAYCQKPCGQGSDGKCPIGAVCIKYNNQYSGCQPDGGKTQGQSCAGAATSCKAGHFCIGPQGGEVCAQMCKVAAVPGSKDACPDASWCSGYGGGTAGVCIPTGAIAIGKSCAGKPMACAANTFCQNWGLGSDAVCISPCSATKACPSGTDCKDYGQAGAYCQPAGGQTQGQPCSNADKPCAVGLACLSAGTTYAMCAKSCKADTDCTGGNLYCATGKWGGWCVPSGTVDEFQSCYNQAWQCKKGLACIGDPAANPGAVCVKQCTGFADVCGTGAKCQYFGNGQSWCVKTGKLAHGSICLGQQNDCDTNTLCVKGTPVPTCLQQCGYGFGPCPADSPCQYFAGSAVQLCVPKGFTVGGPIWAPF
ncbi:MAG: hypothetical protein EXR77_00260 [Myxococcales bacterium]|nr:hypothetical protein [Myxococcales bacterium]